MASRLALPGLEEQLVSRSIQHPYLALALDAAERFAKCYGMSARAADHWGEYIELEQCQREVLARITVLAAGSGPELVVEASAVELDARGERTEPRAPWCWCEAGRVRVGNCRWESALWKALDTARQYLAPLGLMELQREHHAMVTRVLAPIAAVLAEFAAECDAAVDYQDWQAIRIAWPRAAPRFRIALHAGPRDGIWLECESRKAVGLLRRLRWVAQPEACEQHIGAYDDQPALRAALAAAQRLLEEREHRH